MDDVAEYNVARWPRAARSSRARCSTSTPRGCARGSTPTAGSVNSRAAAREAKLRPTVVDGRPVKVNGVISYNFKLR
jgi:hypothetical protein